jgi:hypothetical protein
MNFFRDFSRIDLAELESLIVDQIEESKELDYKREMDLTTREQKQELLKDVSALANTGGGYIVIGIEEEKGQPNSLWGMEENNRDELILQIQQILTSGLQPRLSNLEFSNLVDLKNGKYGFVIKVPKSFAAPHQVTQRGAFYGRHNKGTYKLDAFELKNKFTFQAAAFEKADEFVNRRLLAIKSEETHKKIEGGKVILHLVPLSFLDPVSVDLSKLAQSKDRFIPFYGHAGETQFNSLGYLHFSPGQGPSYTQIFRNGIVESVAKGIFEDPVKNNKLKYLPSCKFETELKKKISQYRKDLRFLGIELFPCIIYLRITEIKGSYLGVSKQIGLQKKLSYPYPDREIVFEPVFIEQKEDYEESLNSLFDQLWQSYGYPKNLNRDQSFNY